MVEPWLRGTLTDVDPVRRQVLHALILAGEDIERWCADMNDAEIVARPFGMASVAFHLRHMARSLDRLLTYAEGCQLTPGQHLELQAEMLPDASAEEVRAEVAEALVRGRRRIMAFDPRTYAEVRGVGRDRLPATVAGLLIHVAEHTQRHAGQAITTAQVVRGLRDTQDDGFTS